MKRKVIIFGAGNHGKQAFDILKENHQIICIVDNDSNLYGMKPWGIPVISVEQLKEYYDLEVDIVIATVHHVEVAAQLKRCGIDIKDYFVMLDGHLYHGRNGNNTYQCCNRCVMDNKSDPFILFDEKGLCNYCTEAFHRMNKIYFPSVNGREKLEELISKVKYENRKNKYDCIMGISGGLDSSYLAYLGHQWGLRVLAVHVDDGYDTDISKSNVEKLVSTTGFDYEVITPDPEQFNDLTLAYMKAGVPNIAIPQDNVLLAFLYKKMRENDIKYFFSGGNFALECILQKGNSHLNTDVKNIMNIHKKFGTKPIDKLEFISTSNMKKDIEEMGILSPRPLNYINYNRDRAFKELNKFCGFQYYGRKHLENKLTAFVQLYWLPKKFGVDKRTSHLSSMIVSGQLTREKALAELQEAVYEEKMMEEYIEFIKVQMHLSDEEFESLMRAEIHQHIEYDLEE